LKCPTFVDYKLLIINRWRLDRGTYVSECGRLKAIRRFERH